MAADVPLVARSDAVKSPALAEPARPRILLVDDDQELLWRDMHTSLDADFELDCVPDPEAAQHHLLGHGVDVILLDLEFDRFPLGFKLMADLQVNYPEIPVIFLSDHPEPRNVVEAMRLGAVNYIAKRNRSEEELKLILRTAMELRRGRIRIQATGDGAEVELIGDSPAMVRVREELRRLATCARPVLITGESGTGKELCARALHAMGAHVGEPCLAINCSAFSPTLLESELFGHEQGAFAEAHRRRIGRLQEAGQGLVYLDGIAEISLEIQHKLSRMLTERRFRPLGSRQEIPLRARIVAGCSSDPVREVRERRLLQPLLLQLGLRLHLPPLRERVEDIAPLTQHLIARKAREMKCAMPALETEALRLLQRQPWAGNVRELGTVIENALIHQRNSTLEPADFQLIAGETYAGLRYREGKGAAEARFQREYFTMFLRATRGNVTEVARLAALPRQTVYRLLKKLGLRSADFRGR
jgi:DNA-binding NtrC family response regulator